MTAAEGSYGSASRRYSKGVFCTAGSSYVVLAPNGDAFFCMSDLEARKKPAFNVRSDGWLSTKQPHPCAYPTCGGCDAPFVARWACNDAGAVIGHTPRLWPHPKVEVKDPAETLAECDGRAKSITWLPSQMCNFTCAYCDYGNGKAFTLERHPTAKGELGINDWLDVWSRLMEQIDYAAVTITGGEPTLAAAFIPVVELISRKFLVNFTTNASQNLLRLARQVNPSHVYLHPTLGQVTAGVDQINLSCHPSSRSYDEHVFRGNVLMLKNAGFNVMVNFVGYPPQLFMATECRRWCDEHDIPFLLLEWGNGDRFGNVAAYTERERAFFEQHVTHDRRVNAVDTPLARHAIAVEPHEVNCSNASTLRVAGTMLNCSGFDWRGSDDVAAGIKIGARLFATDGRSDWRALLAKRNMPALRELRYALPEGELRRGAATPFSFSIDCRDMAPGRYDLIVDAVDEGRFWFAQFGAMPTIVSFRVV